VTRQLVHRLFIFLQIFHALLVVLHTGSISVTKNKMRKITIIQRGMIKFQDLPFLLVQKGSLLIG
jgi:uncharacterized protein YfaT (DUF1175 family)